MSNKIGRPWYKKPTIVISAIVVILAAIIGATWGPLWSSWLNPPPPDLPDFSISVNPMRGEVHQGGVIQTTVTVMGIHGYEHSVSLSASGQPSGVVVTFVPPIGGPTPSYTSTVTINVQPGVSADVYTTIIKGMGADGKEYSCNYILTVIPIIPMEVTLIPKIVVNVPDAFYSGGWMGDWGDITLDDASTDNPHSEPICIKITYSAARSQGEGWAGIYWQYPDKNWGDKPDGRDLTGATQLTFWARGEKGGEKAEFKVGGITGKYPDSIQPPVSTGITVLSDKWQQYTIDLTGKDLSHIIGGFCWVTNKDQNPHGCTIYLDDIRYE